MRARKRFRSNDQGLLSGPVTYLLNGVPGAPQMFVAFIKPVTGAGAMVRIISEQMGLNPGSPAREKSAHTKRDLGIIRCWPKRHVPASKAMVSPSQRRRPVQERHIWALTLPKLGQKHSHTSWPAPGFMALRKRTQLWLPRPKLFLVDASPHQTRPNRSQAVGQSDFGAKRSVWTFAARAVNRQFLLVALAVQAKFLRPGFCPVTR